MNKSNSEDSILNISSVRSPVDESSHRLCNQVKKYQTQTKGYTMKPRKNLFAAENAAFEETI